jgi:hypothetical protein
MTPLAITVSDQRGPSDTDTRRWLTGSPNRQPEHHTGDLLRLPSGSNTAVTRRAR